MAGILDSKKRILDSILTDEGRRQIANGKLRAEFYSFTDASMHYGEETIISGGLDATYRIQLEATDLPQDRVTFEADDAGKLVASAISGSERFKIRSGQIFSASSPNETKKVSGSQFASLSDGVLNSSIDNFKKLYILKSPDPLDRKDKRFQIGTKNANFNITPTRPFNTGSVKTANVNHIESLFQDKRLGHIPNFQFLPPVNRRRTGREVRSPLGEYVNIRQTPILTIDDVEQEIQDFESVSIDFTETSKEGNIFGQLFELAEEEMTKLDVIDFGTFPSQNGTEKHVFFAGKVFIDDNDTHTFVNMFTIVFE